MRDWINLFEGRAYPLADRETDGWYAEGNYKENGGEIVMMTPDEYLAQVRPLVMDELTEENIADLMSHIESGGVLDPLVIFRNGKEDGRHRAHAAKRLGIAEVPVIVFR